MNGDGASAMGGTLGRRSVPFDEHAEMGVIGAALFDNSIIPDLLFVLPTANRFFRASHVTLWQAVIDLHAAGQPVDFVTLDHHLRTGGGIDRLLDHDQLLKIRDCVLHTLDAMTHARIVARSAALRDTIETLDDAIRRCYANRDEAQSITTAAIERLKTIDLQANPDHGCLASEILPDVMRRIERRQQGEICGIFSGFAKLDAMTGGFQEEDLIFLAARPGMGKTSLAMNIIETITVTLKQPSLVMSLEMGNPSIIERILSSISGVPLAKLRTGAQMTTAEMHRLGRAYEEVNRSPLYLIRRQSRQIGEVCNEIRRHVARHKVELVMIDYVQLLSTENPRENEVQALTRISAALKGVAKDTKIPILALSQLNRNIENRTKDERKPKPSDLRGSGALEQDADFVIFLNRPDYYDPNERPNEADVIVSKSRNGPPGEFTLWFEKPLTKFHNEPPVTHRPEDAPF